MILTEMGVTMAISDWLPIKMFVTIIDSYTIGNGLSVIDIIWPQGTKINTRYDDWFHTRLH